MWQKNRIIHFPTGYNLYNNGNIFNIQTPHYFQIYGWLPDPVEGADGVVVKCEGVTLDDQINLGYVGYYDLSNHYFKSEFAARSEGKTDNGTFHSDFFPYVNQQWYLQPIVWVVFNEMRRDSLTRVQCHLIAKNIHVDFTTGEGSVQFEILVE